MLACRIFLLPCFDFSLSCERVGLQNTVYDPCQLSAYSIHILHSTFVALDTDVGIVAVLLGFCCNCELGDLLRWLVALDLLFRSPYVQDQRVL